jgi:hypothetical protein
MVYLRSEEHLQRWLGANGWEPGATLTTSKMNELARRRYWTKLDPDWRPPTEADFEALLADLDLTGDFWALQD